MNVLVHVVLIKVRPDCPANVREDIYRRYQTIREEAGGTQAGILHFALEENLDTRKGITWVEVAYFRDDAALQAFRAHPAHAAITDRLREVADWFVGDYVGPAPACV